MKFFKPVVSILLAITVVVGMVFAIAKRVQQRCEEVKIEIAYEGEHLTVTEADVVELLQKKDLVFGKQVKEIDLKAVHNAIGENNLVKSIDHIGFRGDDLIVKITLKEMLMQVFCNDGQHYFITTDGEVLPYTEKVKERLIIVNGDALPSRTKASTQTGILHNVFAVAKHITQTPERTAQYRQIHINEKEQIELIPTIGKYTILFGDTTRMEEKFIGLDELNRQVMSSERGKEYRHLDVRFEDKIIAS